MRLMINCADFELLGRVFEAEIAGQLLAQIRNKRLHALAEKGWVEEMTMILPGRFPVRVKGWVLTELGRYTYCASCSSERESRHASRSNRGR